MRTRTIALILTLLCCSTAKGQPSDRVAELWQMQHVQILPGKASCYEAIVDKYLRPFYEERRKAGQVADYLFLRNWQGSSTQGWDVLVFVKWASLSAYRDNTGFYPKLFKTAQERALYLDGKCFQAVAANVLHPAKPDFSRR